MKRIVHVECGKPPSSCDCPGSLVRPLQCVVADPKPSGIDDDPED